MIYAIIRPNTDKHVKVNFLYKCNDHDRIYDEMMRLTHDVHEKSCDAASWCELAAVGEIYEFDEGEIEIIERD